MSDRDKETVADETIRFTPLDPSFHNRLALAQLGIVENEVAPDGLSIKNPKLKTALEESVKIEFERQ